jgi:hypothetical protein
MPSEPVVEWLVPLVGSQLDLEDLPLWFADQPIRVVKRDSTFNLLMPTEIADDGKDHVLERAENYTELINGVGRLLNPDFRPVSIADRAFGLNASGSVINTVLALESAELRMKGGVMCARIGDLASADPRQAAGAPFLKAAAHSQQALHALTLIGKNPLSWSNLYVILYSSWCRQTSED